MSNKNMNILYINSHDTGRYISPYGYKVNTPNLQAFAEEGVLFRNCFTANPTCSPSRACLLSGQYAHANGMFGLAHRGFRMNDYSTHISNFLKGEGYHTALCGFQHIADGDIVKEIGYDEILKKENYSIRNVGPLAEEFLSRKHDKPFYLEVGVFETHRKFPEHDAENDPRWCKPPEILPDTKENRLDMARFATCASHFDKGVGSILSCLEKNGLANNTIVLITTDHGIAFPQMKCNLTDHGIGVFFMMRGPGGFKGGKVIDSQISHVDFFPTLCEILGCKKPDYLQGVSFLPLVNGEKESTREEVFAEVNAHAAYEPLRCVRTKTHKYVRHLLKKKKTFVLPNCDAGPSKDTWMDAGWDKVEYDREELYDLCFDPMERNNLARAPEYAAILNDMRSRLDKWMKETGDPALEYGGCPPLPKTAIMNDYNEIDPANDSTTTMTTEFMEKNEIPGMI